MIRYHTGGPNEHVLVYRKGRLVREGAGLNCLVAPGSSVAVVPKSTSEVRLSFTARSADRHRVKVDGDLMFRVVVPEKAAANFDFVVRPETDGVKPRGPSLLSKSVAAVARDILRDEISRMPAERILTADASLGRATLTRLRRSAAMRTFGVQPVNVFIRNLRMSSEVVSCLEAEALENTKMKAVVSAGCSSSFPEPPPPDMDDYVVEGEEDLRRTECTEECPFRHLCDDYQSDSSGGKAWCTLFREFTT